MLGPTGGRNFHSLPRKITAISSDPLSRERVLLAGASKIHFMLQKVVMGLAKRRGRRKKTKLLRRCTTMICLKTTTCQNKAVSMIPSSSLGPTAVAPGIGPDHRHL